MILAAVLGKFIQYPFAIMLGIIIKFKPNISIESGILAFAYIFFIAGFVEEISKRIAIKISKPKTPYKILINSIFVALIFAVLENYGYIYTRSSMLVGIKRALMPFHVIYQIIMALFMIKAYEKKKDGHKIYSKLLKLLSFIVPMLLHTMHNYLLRDVGGININLLIAVVIGIFAYSIIFTSTLWVRKKYPENEENEKKKLNIKKLIFIVIVIAFWIFAFSEAVKDPYTSNINEALTVEEKNIEITANSIEEIEITDSYFYNGTYVKVHLEIKNNGSEKVELLKFYFNLLKNDESIDVASYVADDIINLDIPSGGTSSGYLYFETKLIDGLKLEYIDETLNVENLEDGVKHYYIELN